MSCDVKFIINCLNSEPFLKNYNLISFDSASQEELIQVLNDILAEIDEKNKPEDSLEDPEQTIIRLLNTLRILKYKPADNIASTNFRQGLVKGDKKIIYPILEWLLKNLKDLKKRAYLAQFLVKVEIPLEILADVNIGGLYDQYEKLIEEFKAVHKESMAANTAKVNIAELRADLDAMQREKDIVLKKISQLKKKTENLPEKNSIFHESKLLRIEKEKQKQLSSQIANETLSLQQCQQKQVRAIQQLQDLKQASHGMTSEGIVEKLLEEKEVTMFVANQKLPRELEHLENEMKILESVYNDDNITRNSVAQINSKVDALNEEVNKIIEKHLTSSDPVDEKLAPYKQQATIIAQKKNAVSEKFTNLKSELAHLENELKDKEQKIKNILGGEMLISKEEDFKRYVAKLKTRSNLYKKYRTELAAVKTEGGILARTLDLLAAKAKKLDVDLGLNEEDDKISDSNQLTDDSNTSDPAERKTRDINGLTTSISELQSKIVSCKAQITPSLDELKPLRKECKELSAEHEEAKNIFVRKSAALDSSIMKLKQDVKALEEEHEKCESEKKFIAAQSVIAQVDLQRVTNETQLYLNKNRTESTVKDKINEKIAENERENKILKEEQQSIDAQQTKSLKQRELWTNLELLFKLKHKCKESAKQKDGVLFLEKGAETLILQ